MDENERAVLRRLYELQVELFNHQGEEIDALRKANDSLRKVHLPPLRPDLAQSERRRAELLLELSRSHEVIGQLLHLTAKLAGFS